MCVFEVFLLFERLVVWPAVVLSVVLLLSSCPLGVPNLQVLR